MAPLRWGARGHHGEVSGADGIRERRDAFRDPHREEEFILTAKKRPGPPLLDDGGGLQASLAEIWMGGIHDQVRRQGSCGHHGGDERKDHIIARSVTSRDHNRRPNLGSRKVRKREGGQYNRSPSHL